jgi:hypothetical protein
MWVTRPKRVSRDNSSAECGRCDEAYEQARKPSIRTHNRAFLGVHLHTMPNRLGRPAAFDPQVERPDNPEDTLSVVRAVPNRGRPFALPGATVFFSTRWRDRIGTIGVA